MRRKVNDSQTNETKRYYEVPSEKVQEWSDTIENLAKQRDQYKTERDTLIDDLSWYKAKVSRLERENEKFTVVEAESKEEALEKAKYKIQCPRCESVDIDYEYYYEDSNEPSYIYIICHTCMGVSLEEVRKDSDQ